jgi:hypothetical protein
LAARVRHGDRLALSNSPTDRSDRQDGISPNAR